MDLVDYTIFTLDSFLWSQFHISWFQFMNQILSISSLSNKEYDHYDILDPIIFPKNMILYYQIKTWYLITFFQSRLVRRYQHSYPISYSHFNIAQHVYQYFLRSFIINNSQRPCIINLYFLFVIVCLIIPFASQYLFNSISLHNPPLSAFNTFMPLSSCFSSSVLYLLKHLNASDLIDIRYTLTNLE